MNLKQLEYFVRVAELGSFTRASIALDIAQPALSRQVRLLEVELRQNLLIRNGRGAVPTEAGKLLLDHARGILHQVAAAREDMRTRRGEAAGHVSIGLPPSLSRLMTVPLVQAFRAQLPKAQLTLTEGFSLQMNENLRLGHLDLAVLYNPAPSPDLEVTTLRTEELVLISNRPEVAPGVAPALAASESIGLREVLALPLILPSRPNAFRLLMDGEAVTLGCPLHVAMEVDGLNAILSLVREGLGHAVLPAYTLTGFSDPMRLSLRRIHSPQLMSQLSLVRSSRRPVTETQRRACDIVRAVVEQAIQPLQ